MESMNYKVTTIDLEFQEQGLENVDNQSIDIESKLQSMMNLMESIYLRFFSEKLFNRNQNGGHNLTVHTTDVEERMLSGQIWRIAARKNVTRYSV